MAAGRNVGLRQPGLRRAFASPAEGSGGGGDGTAGVGGTSTSSIERIVETRGQYLTGAAGMTFWQEPFVVTPGTRGSYWRDLHAVDVHIINGVPGGVCQVAANAGYGVIVVDPNDGYPSIPTGGPSIVGHISAAQPFYLFTRFRLVSDPGTGGPGGWESGQNAFVIGVVDANTLAVVGVGIAIDSESHFGAVGGDVNDPISTTGIPSSVARDFDTWHVLELYTAASKFWLKVDNGTAIDVSALFPGSAVIGTPFVEVMSNSGIQPAIDIDHIAFGVGRNGSVLVPLGPDPGGVGGVTALAPLASSGGANPVISFPTITAFGTSLAEAATPAAARALLDLEPGVDLLAYSVALAALAASLTPAGANLVSVVDAAAQRGVLGLGSMATQAAGAVAITGGTITGLGVPAASSDAATKSYVDAAIAGFKWKTSVRAATTAAGTLATAFANGQTVDAVVLATGDRVLLKNQAAGAENGIYTVNASGAPTRATDADSSAELVSAAVFVEEGTANADKAFVCTNNAPIVVGTTALVFTAFASVVGALVAGNNLSDLTNAATARTNLGVAIGSNVQAWDADLDTLAANITAAGHAMAAASSAAAQAALLGSAVPSQGTALTDADQTLTVAGGNVYTQTTALTANRVKTLGTGGTPLTGEVITIIRLDTAAVTLTVKDDAGATLVILPASTKCIVSCRWNGTHFADPAVQRIV